MGSVSIYDLDIEMFGGKWRQNLTWWRQNWRVTSIRHPDIMHEWSYTLSCKTTCPSPCRVHGSSGREWKKYISETIVNQLEHEKTTKWHENQVKALIRLCVHIVWSECLLYVEEAEGPWLITDWLDLWLCKLIWVFAECTWFWRVMLWLKWAMSWENRSFLPGETQTGLLSFRS